jgi:hypothetical protein
MRNFLCLDFKNILLLNLLIFREAYRPSGLSRETGPSCLGGGIFNPDVKPQGLGVSACKGGIRDFSEGACNFTLF